MERRVVVKLDNGQVLGTIWTNRMLDVDEAMELLEIEPTDYGLFGRKPTILIVG